MNKHHWLLLAIIAVGAWVRLWNLGSPPLWVDEAVFVMQLGVGELLARGWVQETLPATIQGLVGSRDEFWIRLPFALSGILTIPALFLVLRDKVAALCLAGLYATFPFFVFWSRLARPYVMVGLFVVLGWRWCGFYLAGLFCSPVTLLGVNLAKLDQRKYWLIYGLVLVLAMGLYCLRPDIDRKFGFHFILHAKRHWYVPILVCLLYLFEFGIPRLVRAYTRIQKGQTDLG